MQGKLMIRFGLPWCKGAIVHVMDILGCCMFERGVINFQTDSCSGCVGKWERGELCLQGSG